jgi:hypothetical protein
MNTTKSRCPECAEMGELVNTEHTGEMLFRTFVCNNDEGFILPDCNTAQWTERFVYSDFEIDMEKTEC